MSGPVRTVAPGLPSNRRLAPKREVNVDASSSPAKSWDLATWSRHLLQFGRIALSLGILVAGVAAAAAARRYVTSSPRFGLRDLRVEGAHQRSVEQIASTAGVTLGTNVIDLDLDDLRAKLEADPWIERATLSRRLPATLSIEVIEREAAAMVALPNGTYLSTSRGELFKKVAPGDPSDLPILTGLTSEEAGADREATAQLVRRALDLVAEVERVGVFGGRVEELQVDADGGLTGVLGKRSVRVAFGKGPYRAKVRQAARLESELARRGARPTVLFLDDDQHPERVVVRLVSALPAASVTVDGPTSTASSEGPGSRVGPSTAGASQGTSTSSVAERDPQTRVREDRGRARGRRKGDR